MRLSDLHLPHGYRLELRMPAPDVPPDLDPETARRWVSIRLFFGDTIIWDEAGGVDLLDRVDDTTAADLTDLIARHRGTLRLVP